MFRYKIGFHHVKVRHIEALFYTNFGQAKEYRSGGGGVIPEKLGGGVQPASQNPYPIYDQNLRYSLPYLWPDF